jgi:hypothetical protein
MEFIVDIAAIRCCDYEVRCAGDDNSLYIRKCTWIQKNKEIVAAYGVVFTTDMDAKSAGLGQKLKFLKLGVIEQGDFCSSHNFKTTRNGYTHYRVIRHPIRYIQGLCYKDADTDLTDQEWMYATGRCDLAWASGLPIFEALANYKMTNGVDTCHEQIVSKLKHPNMHVDESYQGHMEDYDIGDTLLEDHLMRIISPKKYYQMREKKSDNEVQDYQACVDWLNEFFDISYAEIVDFEKYIKQLDVRDHKFSHIVLLKLENGIQQTDLVSEVKPLY